MSIPTSAADNAVLLPLLVPAMRAQEGSADRVTPSHSQADQPENADGGAPARQPTDATRQRGQEFYLNASWVGWLVLGAILLAPMVIRWTLSTATTPTSTHRALGAGVKAELDWDRRQIEIEKDKAERMTRELEELAAEIQRERFFLNRTREIAIAVASLNRKVDRHNVLLEELRAQERHVNQLVDSYNRKLR